MQGHAKGDHCGAKPKQASWGRGPVFGKYSWKKGGEHCSPYGRGHHCSILCSFSDRAHGVPFLRGEEERARRAGRNQEERWDVQGRTSAAPWRRGLISMLTCLAGEKCLVLRVVATAKSSSKSECAPQDHILVSLVQTHHLL